MSDVVVKIVYSEKDGNGNTITSPAQSDATFAGQEAFTESNGKEWVAAWLDNIVNGTLIWRENEATGGGIDQNQLDKAVEDAAENIIDPALQKFLEDNLERSESPAYLRKQINFPTTLITALRGDGSSKYQGGETKGAIIIDSENLGILLNDRILFELGSGNIEVSTRNANKGGNAIDGLKFRVTLQTIVHNQDKSVNISETVFFDFPANTSTVYMDEIRGLGENPIHPLLKVGNPAQDGEGTAIPGGLPESFFQNDAFYTVHAVAQFVDPLASGGGGNVGGEVDVFQFIQNPNILLLLHRNSVSIADGKRFNNPFYQQVYVEINEGDPEPPAPTGYGYSQLDTDSVLSELKKLRRISDNAPLQAPYVYDLPAGGKNKVILIYEAPVERGDVRNNTVGKEIVFSGPTRFTGELVEKITMEGPPADVKLFAFRDFDEDYIPVATDLPPAPGDTNVPKFRFSDQTQVSGTLNNWTILKDVNSLRVTPKGQITWLTMGILPNVENEDVQEVGFFVLIRLGNKGSQGDPRLSWRVYRAFPVATTSISPGDLLSLIQTRLNAGTPEIGGTTVLNSWQVQPPKYDPDTHNLWAIDIYGPGGSTFGDAIHTNPFIYVQRGRQGADSAEFLGRLRSNENFHLEVDITKTDFSSFFGTYADDDETRKLTLITRRRMADKILENIRIEQFIYGAFVFQMVGGSSRGRINTKISLIGTRENGQEIGVFEKNGALTYSRGSVDVSHSIETRFGFNAPFRGDAPILTQAGSAAGVTQAMITEAALEAAGGDPTKLNAFITAGHARVLTKSDFENPVYIQVDIEISVELINGNRNIADFHLEEAIFHIQQPNPSVEIVSGKGDKGEDGDPRTVRVRFSRIFPVGTHIASIIPLIPGWQSNGTDNTGIQVDLNERTRVLSREIGNPIGTIGNTNRAGVQNNWTLGDIDVPDPNTHIKWIVEKEFLYTDFFTEDQEGEGGVITISVPTGFRSALLKFTHRDLYQVTASNLTGVNIPVKNISGLEEQLSKFGIIADDAVEGEIVKLGTHNTLETLDGKIPKEKLDLSEVRDCFTAAKNAIDSKLGISLPSGNPTIGTKAVGANKQYFPIVTQGAEVDREGNSKNVTINESYLEIGNQTSKKILTFNGSTLAFEDAPTGAQGRLGVWVHPVVRAALANTNIALATLTGNQDTGLNITTGTLLYALFTIANNSSENYRVEKPTGRDPVLVALNTPERGGGINSRMLSADTLFAIRDSGDDQTFREHGQGAFSIDITSDKIRIVENNFSRCWKVELFGIA